MILLTGVTGKIGNEVINLIKDKPCKVRALVRDVDKVSYLANSNIEVVQGSFDDIESIKSALAEVQKLFLLPPNNENQLQQEISIIDLAREEGVDHIVKLSVLTTDPISDNDILFWHGKAEKYLEDSGIAYTHLQPNFFMQNFIFHASQTIKDEGTFNLPMRDGKCGLVDVRDIASVVVGVLTQDGHENKTYQITGPESLDFYEMADVFSSILEKQISYIDVSPEDCKAELTQYGIPEILSEAVKDLYVRLSEGNLDKVSDHVFEITKNHPISFEKFVLDHKHLFQQ